jgi:TonB family protein
MVMKEKRSKKMLKTILTRSLLLFFSLALLGAGSVYGQATCSLTLNISDLSDNSPLRGAAATAKRLKYPAKKVISNEKGVAYFFRLPAAKYAITVSKRGYEPAATSINCNTAKKTASIDILQKIPDVTTLKMRPKGAIILKGNTPQGPVTSPTPNMTMVPDADYEMPPPTPIQPPRPGNSIVNRGVINGSAISLPKPAYPAVALAVGAEGPVKVQVTIDENGNVISATAVSGHPLLKQSAVEAAKRAKFTPTLLLGTPVKVAGIIVYNFLGPKKSKS